MFTTQTVQYINVSPLLSFVIIIINQINQNQSNTTMKVNLNM